MKEPSFKEKQEANLSIHIFSVSATLVGVCLTVIGIMNFITNSRKVETIIDDILAYDAILFLICCILSYISMKIEQAAQRMRLETMVDKVFILALAIMVLMCFFIVLKI